MIAPSRGQLEGKKALVTGSTSGIGLGIATALAAEGASVMLNGLGDEAALRKAMSEVRAVAGGRVEFTAADMRRPDEIEALIHETADRFDRLDILVNSAGIQFVSKIEDFPVEKWDDIIAVNLSSAFHTIRCATSLMMTNNFGRIVNVASAHSLVASPFKAAYVAAKHGLAGLTKTVALELAENGITVNAVAPGYVKTPLVEKQVADTARARGITEEQVVQDVMLAAQPTKRFVTIEQVAECVVFLCRESAGSITGSVLSVDGGWSAQ